MGFIIFTILCIVLLAVIVTLCMGFIPRIFFFSTYIKPGDQTGYE